MIDLLVLGCYLQLLGLAQPRPQDIPLATIRWHNSDSRRLHRVDHRVVNMRRVVHLEPQRHVLVHHAVLVDHLDLLSDILLNLLPVINYLQECVGGRQAVAVLWVREKHTYTFCEVTH
jgi:hypothetical protein